MTWKSHFAALICTRIIVFSVSHCHFLWTLFLQSRILQLQAELDALTTEKAKLVEQSKQLEHVSSLSCLFLEHLLCLFLLLGDWLVLHIKCFHAHNHLCCLFLDSRACLFLFIVSIDQYHANTSCLSVCVLSSVLTCTPFPIPVYPCLYLQERAQLCAERDEHKEARSDLSKSKETQARWVCVRVRVMVICSSIIVLRCLAIVVPHWSDPRICASFCSLIADHGHPLCGHVSPFSHNMRVYVFILLRGLGSELWFGWLYDAEVLSIPHHLISSFRVLMFLSYCFVRHSATWRTRSLSWRLMFLCLMLWSKVYYQWRVPSILRPY